MGQRAARRGVRRARRAASGLAVVTALGAAVLAAAPATALTPAGPAPDGAVPAGPPAPGPRHSADPPDDGPAASAGGPDRREAARRAAVRAALQAAVDRGIPGAVALTTTDPGTSETGTTRTGTSPAGGSRTGTDEGPGAGGAEWFGHAGVADLATGRERQPADHFRAGSITKTFVATVVLQLEAEGVLDLDDTVETWLPGLLDGNGHDGRAVTVRHLLQHTSGLPDYTADPEVTRRLAAGSADHHLRTRTPEQLIAVALSHPPVFAPGTGWSYSNTGYLVAGLIVEKATGRTWADQVRTRIVEPLGLTGTSLPGTRSTLPGPHPVGYAAPLSGDPDAPPRDVTRLNPSWAGAAGEIVSTASDLNRFYRALLRGRLLPERQQSAMFRSVPLNPAGTARYGLGVESWTLSCGTTVWGHAGGIHGSASRSLGTADGSHLLTYHLNGDWLTGSPLQDAIAEAAFCPTTPASSGSG
ncbi:serine hydrolase domain-containing protein [Streptomyces sp. 549]|uniref:serine hydrolase domain-containing protein n=1 Tax=Streptomyces sp. 549 TaxID=3049076 RepID=UPI0024C36982|nr:serine hydrolase domain-containing protein [Streptomyces sp. 549]MDK1474922.1 serine hydrolase domain-containing protein [Streptomyces sp. 549]